MSNYALARAPLIEHSLDFQRDYRAANASFRGGRLDESVCHAPVHPRLERAAWPGLKLFRAPRAALTVAWTFLSCLILWNMAFMFQWGTHLIPARGSVSFREVVHNQVFVVPRQLTTQLQNYLLQRKALMQQIERHDMEQIEKDSTR